MTGHGDEKVAVEMMKLGARDYLVKDAEFLDVLPPVVKRVVEQLEVERRLSETELKLKESEEKYHDLIEFANVGIIAVENDKIVQINKRAEEIYGYSKEELISQSLDILIPEKYRKKYREILNEILKSGKAKKMIFEEEGIRKDGSSFPLEISFSLSHRGENTLTIIAVVRDITERKKMEEKLIQSEKLSALGELAGGVAHDFNNMLAAILGRVQLLRMHNSPLPGVREKRKSVRELQKGLEIIEKAAMDGAETVRRIQEFSRRRSDDKDFTQVDVNELINSALEFTRMRWKDAAESKGIKIVV
jgi:PAS domain S-box-containing protein